VTKTRVHDLAKQYGMSGKDLAAKLRDLGFAKVKSHMTALDEFEVLQVQGRLEAHGLTAVSASDDEGAENLGGGLVVRRKKKKRKPAEEAAPPEEPPAAEAEAEPAPAEEPVVEVEPAPQPEPAAPEPVAEAVEPEPAAAEPEVAPTAQVEPEVPAAEAVETPAVEPQAEPVEEAPAPEPAAETVAETTTEAAAEATAEPAEKAETPEKEGDAKGAATEEDGKVVRPGEKRRAGKVVGFVDLSKIQPTQPQRRTQSRRLRSGDDAAPDVQPTLGRNLSRALQRGDRTSRGQLTAQQLRQREQDRFRRRFGPGGARGGQDRRGGGHGGRSSAPKPSGSPYAGTTVKVEEPLTVRELADAIAIKGKDLLQASFRELGFGAVQLNSTIDNETAGVLAALFDVELEMIKPVEAEEAILTELAEKRSSIEDEHLEVRSPTVAFLGHVDHGKTTLIDKIRESQVADGEAGGITQHIGAYKVTTQAGHNVTVIDTPGHAAFSAMRARGAKAVDVVVLVVAADDGVMPQTEEAAAHAKAAGCPIIVALNKADKPEANFERVKQQLMGLELTPEEFGGDTAMIPVSGLRGDGLDDLLERVFLEGEVLELKSHDEGPAAGVVLEAEKEEGKGIVAHLLILDGHLKTGDVILAGEGYGRVRALIDDRGKQIPDAGPSTPVEVSGLSELPAIGENFHVVESLAQAKQIAEERARKNRQLLLAERGKKGGASLLEVGQTEKSVINLIVKTDVQGTLQALREQLATLIHPEVEVVVVHSAVGTISESDVNLAIPADAQILAFHVPTSSKARQAADRGGITIRNYDVIYELLDDVHKMMEGSLAPEVSEEVTGHIEIRRIFKSSKLGNIAGCYVLDGKVRRDDRLRLQRVGDVIYEGRIGTLKRMTEDAKEVREGFECGIVIKGFSEIEEGDILETYRLVETKRQLEL
jgi:translation initiation factor IF-2